MNLVMLKTELYKFFSRKVVWVAMALFLLLFLVVKLQFIAKPGVVYTFPAHSPPRSGPTRLSARAYWRGGSAMPTGCTGLCPSHTAQKLYPKVISPFIF